MMMYGFPADPRSGLAPNLSALLGAALAVGISSHWHRGGRVHRYFNGEIANKYGLRIWGIHRDIVVICIYIYN